MRKNVRFSILILLILLLFVVRAFEDSFFYDPFVQYFKDDYLKGEFPIFKMGPLLVHLFGRYAVNSAISLSIIYGVFMNKEDLLLAIKFYVIAFLILAIFYFVHLKFEFSNGYLFEFYIRRILIHPVLLLLFLPAFYFKNKMNLKV